MTDTLKFNPDRPIKTKEKDALGRERFVEILSASIAEWKGKNDSLVLGLTGPWGCGKSSIKNLVLEQFELNKSIQSIEFNPWEWSNSDKVSEAFFQEVGKLFKRKDFAKQSEELSKKWQYYAELVNLISEPIPPAGVFANLFGSAAKAHKARQEYLKKEFEVLKGELSEELSKIPQTILIILDDIDRLLPEELKVVIQLIKANADFPNVVYLLLLDKDVVGLSLGRLVEEKGKDYLDKIIQVEITVPMPSREDIISVLDKNIKSILEPITISFDGERWKMVFFVGLQHLFTNLRDVYRFHNRLSFQLQHYLKGKTLEINIVDLMLLISLDLFAPDCFRAIKQQKQFLTNQPSSNEAEKNKNVLNAIIELAPKIFRDAVKEIIADLFPYMQTLIGSGYGVGPSLIEQWGREKRLCHPDWFDAYFGMSLPDNFISSTDESQIRKSIEVGNYQELLELFTTYADSNRFGLLIDYLKAIQAEIQDDKITNLMGVLFTLGDFIPNENNGIFTLSLHDRLGIYSWRLLENKVDVNKRKSVFLEALRLSSGISIPAIIIRRSLDDKYHGFWGKDDDVSEQKAACVNRIKELISKEGLWSINRIGHLFVYFGEWENEADVKKLIKDKLTDNDAVIKFLIAMLTESQFEMVSKPGIQKRYSMNLKAVEKLIDVDELKILVDKIDKELLEGLYKKAVDTFYLALRRKAEGKPDGNWDVDEDDED